MSRVDNDGKSIHVVLTLFNFELRERDDEIDRNSLLFFIGENSFFFFERGWNSFLFWGDESSVIFFLKEEGKELYPCFFFGGGALSFFGWAGEGRGRRRGGGGGERGTLSFFLRGGELSLFFGNGGELSPYHFLEELFFFCLVWELFFFCVRTLSFFRG